MTAARRLARRDAIRLAAAGSVAVVAAPLAAWRWRAARATPTTAECPPDLKQGTQEVSAGTVAAGFNQFGFRLSAHLLAGSGNDNVFVSPLSAALALSMTLNGAAGATYDEMAAVLGLSGGDRDAINSAVAALVSALQGADNQVTLGIANSLWSRQGYVFDQQFIDRVLAAYDARLRSLDFGDPAAIAEINGWVREKTAGRIDGLVQQLDPAVVLLLINALYFKAEWSAKFEETATQPRPFRRESGGDAEVQMMYRTGRYAHADLEGVQVVALPFARGRFRMLAALPAAGLPISTFVVSLTSEWLQSRRSALQQRTGTVAIPRFRLQFDASLNEPLQALGLVQAFDSARADFREMRQQGELFISDVRQKTFVEVNEAGAEAAAATSVAISITSALVQPPEFEFIADRPFWFAIEEMSTGVLLFSGVYRNPQ